MHHFFFDFVVFLKGGVRETPCPYKCTSDRYHMPNCNTAFEELVYTFGGPWVFSLLLIGLLILLALVLSVARMKYIGGDDIPGHAPAQDETRINHSFPFLESLNEVYYHCLCEILTVLRDDKLILELNIVLGFTFIIIFLSSFRSLKQIEVRSLRVMFTGCISKALILLVNRGIYLTVPPSK